MEPFGRRLFLKLTGAAATGIGLLAHHKPGHGPPTTTSTTTTTTLAPPGCSSGCYHDSYATY